MLAVQILQGRERLGINSERDGLIGPWRPPKYVLGFSHGKCGGLRIALKTQGQYYIDPHRFDTANSGT